VYDSYPLLLDCRAFNLLTRGLGFYVVHLKSETTTYSQSASHHVSNNKRR